VTTLAVRFNSATDGYTATTGFPTGSAATVTCWVRLATDRNTFNTVWAFDDFSGNLQAGLYTEIDGEILQAVDSSYSLMGDLQVPIGTWCKTGVVMDGTAWTFYLGFESCGDYLVYEDTQVTYSNLALFRVGRGPATATDEYLDGDVAGLKVWRAALTREEVEAEFDYADPVSHLGEIVRCHPFETAPGLTDTSGLGRHLTAGSTSTDTSDSPYVLQPPLRTGNTSTISAMPGVST
jgi:hypothetical protein